MVKFDYESDDSVILIQEDMLDNKKPSLNKMHSLLQEATKNKYPRSFSYAKFANRPIKKQKSLACECLLNSLEKELEKALECQKVCNEFIEAYKVCKSKSAIGVWDESSKNEHQRDILTLSHLKELHALLNTLVCEIDSYTSDTLIYIYNESIEQERIVQELVGAWKLDDKAKIRQALNYANLVRFSDHVIDKLKLMQRQIVWLQAIGKASESPETLTIDLLKSLCDQVKSEGLLDGEMAISKRVVQERFNEMNELLTIAQAWDNRAKRALETK